MVLKQSPFCYFFFFLFENDVKMYGTQAKRYSLRIIVRFENDVKMYGTQANEERLITTSLFENDVKMYGTQAISSHF